MVLNFLARVRPELTAGFDAGGGAE
jgi:hypothetical protein